MNLIAKKHLAAFALAAITSTASQAIVLVQYDNSSNDRFDSGIPQAAAYVAPLVTASDFTSHGLEGVQHEEAYQIQGWSEGPTLDPDKYISFSVGAQAGYEIQFDSFSIDLWQATQWFGMTQFTLRSGADGFSQNLFNGTVEYVAQNPHNVNYSFSLASLAPQTGPTDFRLYFYNGAIGSLISMGGMGNGVELSGSLQAAVSPVPEPGQMALMGAGLALLAVWGRRRPARQA